MMRAFLVLVLVLLVASSCGAGGSSSDSSSDSSSVSDSVSDSSSGDSSSVSDSSSGGDSNGDSVAVHDANPADTVASDANPDADAFGDPDCSDAGCDISGGKSKQTAWGSIEGACGLVAAELNTSQPSFLQTTYTFSGASFDPASLAVGAKKRYDGVNAGGSSKCSEVMSMQLLVDCEGGGQIKTETEITYTSSTGAITDYALSIAGTKVGVSVTRAYLGPTNANYTEADATKLLQKKLDGIVESSAKVAPADKWTKQVLHVWTLQPSWVPILQAAWQKLDAATRADTIVLVTVEVSPGWIVKDDCGAP